jgi:uncharacterized protein YkwD
MLARLVIVLVLAGVLPGCGALGLGWGGDSKSVDTVPSVPRERSVNPQRAADIINAYRASRGRPALTLDPKLNAVAAETARELARRDQLRTELHTPEGLARRLEAADYEVERAAENLGAGYPTLEMAVEGWKGSRGHNRNLLRRDMTHVGIGLAVTDRGVFKSYWVLLFSRPDERA